MARRFSNTSTIVKTTTNQPAPIITTVSLQDRQQFGITSAPDKQTRTVTTVSAPVVTATKWTSSATVDPRRKTFVKPVTISPPASNLTGGRIAQIPSKPVTVTFASGQKQTMNLSTDAIKYYQNLGLKVSPVQTTFGGVNPMQSIFGAPTQNTYNPSPQIVPIQNPSVAYDQNPPPQLHVDNNPVVKPNTRTNSNFGGLGANPWNPLEAIAGLFGMAPQQDPASQWLPQQQDNTQSTGYPPYTAMQPQIIQDHGLGFNETMTDPSQTIKNLFQNKYILYAGLAVGALVVLKIVMGFGGGKGGGGGTKIYT